MADVYMPRNEEELAGFVKDANAGRHPLEICGFRSKREAGRPMNASAVISAAKLSGITLYEPKELVISAKAGTPLYEVEAALARHNQELAFEPADFSRIYGVDALAASIGAIAAMNISGPRRILRGAARDHMLGIRAVNGEGRAHQVRRAGDEECHRRRPRAGPERLLGHAFGVHRGDVQGAAKGAREPHGDVPGAGRRGGHGVMSAAMGTPYEVSGTIHLHGALTARLSDQEIAPARTALTALRLEGAPRSLAYRVEKLRRELAPFGDTYELDPQRSQDFWADIRSLSFLVRRFRAAFVAHHHRAFQGRAHRARAVCFFRGQCRL